jgi:hypothetical protein
MMLLLIHIPSSSPQHVLSLLSLLCFHQLSGNGFQRRRFLKFCVHVLTDRRLSHNQLKSRLFLLKTPWHRLHRKHCFPQFFYCVILLSHRLHIEHRFALSPLAHIRNLLLTNGRCLQSHYSATGLFVPNSLQAYCHFFFPEGCACDICDRPHLPSPWIGSHGAYSPTAPDASSLRPLIPSGSLIRCKPVQVYHHQPRSRVPLWVVRAEVLSGRCSCISGS